VSIRFVLQGIDVTRIPEDMCREDYAGRPPAHRPGKGFVAHVEREPVDVDQYQTQPSPESCVGGRVESEVRNKTRRSFGQTEGLQRDNQTDIARDDSSGFRDFEVARRLSLEQLGDSEKFDNILVSQMRSSRPRSPPAEGEMAGRSGSLGGLDDEKRVGPSFETPELWVRDWPNSRGSTFVKPELFSLKVRSARS